MPFDKIMLDLLENAMLGLKFSIKDLCFIWGRYELTDVKDKLTVQYTNDATKATNIEFFPDTSNSSASFEYIQ